VVACADDPKAPGEDAIPEALLPLDRTAIMTHVGRLAHDSMAGRGSGTVDELRSAQYIAQQFQSFGLQAGPSGYLMPFAISPTRVGGRTGVTSQNVIGILPGAGALRNEWVVLGAHYDHVGIRTVAPDSSAVFNGADDNASGTALLLQIAQYVASYVGNGGLGNLSRRSVMFVAFGAEELGLLGSEQYCAQPAYPLTTVAAMLNFDMVGRMQDRWLRIGGIPTSPEWIALLVKHNTGPLAFSETDCANCTDFACFRRNQRPVLWFFTGLHDDYHQPSDDTALINTEGIGQIGDLVVRLTIDLLLTARAPSFAQ
jgi:hypothetical protein